MPYHTTKKTKPTKKGKGKVPAGYHRMPNGSIMKNGKHKKKK